VAAADLVSLEEVRAQLQLQTVETELDDVVQPLITAYSVEISRHCGRQFAPAEDGATHRFRLRPGSTLDGLYLLDLAPFDLRAATLVQLHPETTTPVTLTQGVDYVTEPVNPRDGVYTSLELYPLRITWTSTAAINFGHLNVDVTGDWGFEEVPENVKQACILAVTSALRENVQAFGGAIQPNSIGEDVNAAVALTPGVRGLLTNHVRRVTF
jgi:hypothetical protein